MDPRAAGHRLIWTTVLGNLFGGLLTYFYCRVIDYRVRLAPRPFRRTELAYFVILVRHHRRHRFLARNALEAAPGTWRGRRGRFAAGPS